MEKDARRLTRSSMLVLSVVILDADQLLPRSIFPGYDITGAKASIMWEHAAHIYGSACLG